MAQKRLWNPAGEKILRERGALPKEEGDAIREYTAMNEGHFLSSWLRQDGREKEERTTVEVSNENEEERGERGREKRRKKRTKR